MKIIESTTHKINYKLTATLIVYAFLLVMFFITDLSIFLMSLFYLQAMKDLSYLNEKKSLFRVIFTICFILISTLTFLFENENKLVYLLWVMFLASVLFIFWKAEMQKRVN